METFKIYTQNTKRKVYPIFLEITYLDYLNTLNKILENRGINTKFIPTKLQIERLSEKTFKIFRGAYDCNEYAFSIDIKSNVIVGDRTIKYKKISYTFLSKTFKYDYIRHEEFFDTYIDMITPIFMSDE